jgi:hypothetical protein
MTACTEALVLVAVQRIWPESLTPAASVMVKPELEGIRINQHAVTVDEADMLAGLEWMVALNGKDCSADNLACGVNSRRPRFP